MKIEILSIAESEFTETVNYYNNQSEGLGYEFATGFKSALERIIQHPNAWAKISNRARRSRLTRFPYGIIYYNNSCNAFEQKT
jgi:toxin ParE1/3/4